MIKVQNISKKFKTHFWDKEHLALNNVSFEINKGEVVGFLGANGAGKTTIIKIIMGFIKENKGSIIYKEGINRRLFLTKVGYVPERPFFYPYLKGLEFLEYMASLTDLDDDKLRTAIEYWGEKLLIKHALDKKIRDYSKGMLQRLGFLSAIIHGPDFLILDEPLSGLDPIGRKSFKDVINELNDQGVTIFFSSHIVSDVEEICSKVIVLDSGKVIYQGKISDLIDKNSSENVKINFVDNKNVMKGVEKENDETTSLIVLQDNLNSKLKEILDIPVFLW